MNIYWNNKTDLRVCKIFKELGDLKRYQKHIRSCLYRMYAAVCHYYSVNRYYEVESLVMHATTGTPESTLAKIWNITFDNGEELAAEVEELIKNKVIRKADKMLFTVMDIETTGFKKDEDEILSFSYLVMNKNGDKVRAETFYFYNENIARKWNEAAYKIHGLTKEFLKEHAGNFEEDLRRMFVILSKSNLVTYKGITFDLPFCKNWLIRNLGINVLEVESHYDMYKILSSHGMRGKLGVNVERCKIPAQAIDMMSQHWFKRTGCAHESHYDVVMTAMLLQYAINKDWIREIEVSDQDGKAKDMMFEENKTFESDFFYLKEEDGRFYKTRLCTDPTMYWYVFTGSEVPPAGTHVFNQKTSNTYEDGQLRITVNDDTVTMEVI